MPSEVSSGVEHSKGFLHHDEQADFQQAILDAAISTTAERAIQQRSG